MSKFILIIVSVMMSAMVFIPKPSQNLVDGIERPKPRDTVEALKHSDNASMELVETIPVTCQDFTKMLSKYDWDVKLMSAIMMAESRCNTNAIGDTWVINGVYAPSCGLFQVRTLSSRPSCEALQDPATNIEWAYKIYKGQGLHAWSVYSNGMYKVYLGS